MAHRRRALLSAVLAIAFAALSASAATAQNVVERAAEAGQFDMFVSALRQTGLAVELRGPGPFTLFAPTDAAFADMPDAEQRRLLNPADPEQLERLLAFHVVPGALPSDRLNGTAAIVQTLAPHPLAFNGTATPINVGGARVTTTDLEAVNGIVHGVDRVLLAPEFSR